MNKHHQTFIILLLVFGACGKKNSRSSLEFEDGPIENRRISFEELKVKVIAPKCIRCHAEFENEKGLRRVIYPQHPDESHLYLHMADGSMPTDAPPVSSEDLALTKCYIEHLPPGAPGKHNADAVFPDLPLPPGRGLSRGREYD